jgi:hypothetical protein
LTVTFLRLTKSRTWTTPRLTVIFVLVHVSCVSHLVPRTVAAARRPLVRKRPLPSPHRLRTFFFFLAAADALAQLSVALSSSCVIGFLPLVCVTLNWPF